MRNRYFFITSTVLLIVTTVSIYLYTVFLRKERLAFIDQQVRETAAALVDSQLGDLRKINFDEADDIISDELGESRIGKFFIIRNSQGDTVFESSSAKLLPIAEIPKDQKWFEITTKGSFIRGLNLQLPRFPDRTLQVGLLLDDSIVNPSILSSSSVTFLFLIFAFGIISSFVLTSFLLRPIGMLGRFLSEISIATKNQAILPRVPEKILANARLESRDEFERVVAGLNLLVEKVNTNYRLSRMWAYQMAHELKTPLARAMIGIERLQKAGVDASGELLDVRCELSRISETINSFLGWAELENSTHKKHMYMNVLGDVVQRVTSRLPINLDRLKVVVEQGAVVPANPFHLEQVIQNLVLNAFNHTAAGSEVAVVVGKNSLLIKDQGSGVPKDVLDRIGEPFNRGHVAMDLKSPTGHGLGLAWVNSICRLYEWTLTFDSSSGVNQVMILFPPGSPKDEDRGH